MSDDGLTASSSLRHVCLTRHARAVFGADRDLVEQSSLFLVVGRRRLRSDHEEIHGGKPFSGPTQPTLSCRIHRKPGNPGSLGLDQNLLGFVLSQSLVLLIVLRTDSPVSPSLG